MLAEEALTRLQNCTAQKRRTGHETFFVNFRRKTKVQRVLGKSQPILFHTVSPRTNIWVRAIENGLGHNGLYQNTPPVSPKGKGTTSVLVL